MPIMQAADHIAVVEEIELKNRLAGFDSLDFDEKLALVVAIDQWVVDNAASFNAALPQPARGVLSAIEKAQAFSYVVRRRMQKRA